MSDDVLNNPTAARRGRASVDPGGRVPRSRGDQPVPGSGERVAGTTQLVLLVAASCMSVLGAVLIAPVLPAMSRAFASTAGVDALVPLVLTAPALVIGLTSPFAGVIVDKLDRKRLLLIAMVAYAVLGTAPLYLQSLTLILVSRVLVGVCEAAIMVSATTLIGDYWTGAARARNLGLQTLVAALAATVFVIVGGALGKFGWRVPFWMYVIALVLVPLLAKHIWQPSAGERTPGPVGRLAPIPWKVLAAPLATTLFGGIVFYALIVHLSYVLNGVGFTSTAAIGGITAIMSLFTALGAVVFGRLSGRTPRFLVPLEFGLSGVGLLLIFATSSVPVITVGAILTGFGTGMMLPTLLTWSLVRLTFEQRGRGTGLFTGVLFIGEFICPLIVLAIKGGTGGYHGAMGVLGLVSIVAAVILVVALRRNTQALNTSELGAAELI